VGLFQMIGGKANIMASKVTHHVEINRKLHRIQQFGQAQPIDIVQEYTADCRDCGEGINATTWAEVQGWAQQHVGIELVKSVNYATMARAQQENIERLLEERD
jgi:hypothetical protein